MITKVRLRWIAGWVFVRPIRWLFHRMTGGCYLQKWPTKAFDGHWCMPNYHWWLLYCTVFRFFNWLSDDAWRPFCAWSGPGGSRSSFPLSARIIHKIGRTTAGYAISGGACFHCASEDGDPVELSEDETGRTFRLEKSWSVATMDGTDYRFCGTTVCPACAYESHYEDGSL